MKLLADSFKLAESPLWNDKTQELLWVDILGKKILRLVGDEILTTECNEYVSFLALTSDNRLIVALESGVYIVDDNINLQNKNCILTFPEDNLRCNDGGVDPKGRLLLGRMDNLYNENDKVSLHNGYLLQVSSPFSSRKLLDGIYISNGIQWNNEGNYMYYIDSYLKSVMRYSYNIDSGNLGKFSSFVTFTDGCPDGMAKDMYGNLWIAVYGEGRVVCTDSKTGEFLEEISVDNKNVTNCTFGGENLDKLYITTGQSAKMSGAIYVVDAPVRGAAEHKFIMS